MKSIFSMLFCMFFFSQIAHGQKKYDFISSNYVEVNAQEFLDFVQTQKNAVIENYLENGQKFTKAKEDSLRKAKILHEFSVKNFVDSTHLKVIRLYQRLSKEAVKERNQTFQDKMKSDEKNRKNLIKTKVSELNLTDIHGKKYQLSDLKGKVVVLNFWYTTCAPCIKEIPDLNQMHADFKDKNAVFFAITFDEKEKVNRFLKKFQIDFHVVPQDQKTIDQFGISFFPTNIILNPEGTVVYVNEFFMKDMIKDMRKTIKKLVQ